MNTPVRGFRGSRGLPAGARAAPDSFSGQMADWPGAPVLEVRAWSARAVFEQDDVGLLAADDQDAQIPEADGFLTGSAGLKLPRFSGQVLPWGVIRSRDSRS